MLAPAAPPPHACLAFSALSVLSPPRHVAGPPMAIYSRPGMKRKPARTKPPRRDAGKPPSRQGSTTAASSSPAGLSRVISGQVRIERRWPAILLALCTMGGLSLIFPPVGWWPLAYVCLVPWLVVVCTMHRARFVYFLTYLLGLGTCLINLYWMAPVTVEGYLAMCVYFAAFFPLAAWPIRHMCRRRGMSVAFVAPVVWVTVEYLRSISVLGFPFQLLGHSHYRVIGMIQISDLVGAYGVSFVLAMVNGWLTDLVIQPIMLWRSAEPGKAARMPIGSLTTGIVVAGTLIYGETQRSDEFLTPGPKIAVVQGDFVMYVDKRAGRTRDEQVFETYLELARQAAATKPDLVVLPETAWGGSLNDEFVNATAAELDEIRERRYPPEWTLAHLEWMRDFSRRTRQAFQTLSDQSGVPILLGSSSMEWKPRGIPPRADRYNSAFLLEPGAKSPVARYDKVHLVLFGEYVPFRHKYHSVYQWLNAQTPWGRNGMEYSLTPGDAFSLFEFDAAFLDGKACRFGVPICYEEAMPYVAREFVTGGDSGAEGDQPSDRKRTDLLVCISNDGWFHHTSELEQHLATGVFRAVENRVAVARSVNTGTSALIDPNGEIHHRVLLSGERIELLGPVSKALETLAGDARSIEAVVEDRNLVAVADLDESQKAQAAARNIDAVRPDLLAFAKPLAADLVPALAAIGPEFAFVANRLNRLAGDTLSWGQQPADAAWALRSQVEDDLAAVARWRDRPWTAPGYNVGRLDLDHRLTIYSRFGDWFAQGALVLTILMALDWLVGRFRRRKAVDAVVDANASKG